MVALYSLLGQDRDQPNLVQLPSTQILGVHIAILSFKEPENPGQDKLGLPATWDWLKLLPLSLNSQAKTLLLLLNSICLFPEPFYPGLTKRGSADKRNKILPQTLWENVWWYAQPIYTFTHPMTIQIQNTPNSLMNTTPELSSHKDKLFQHLSPRQFVRFSQKSLILRNNP